MPNTDVYALYKELLILGSMVSSCSRHGNVVDVKVLWPRDDFPITKLNFNYTLRPKGHSHAKM